MLSFFSATTHYTLHWVVGLKTVYLHNFSYDYLLFRQCVGVHQGLVTSFALAFAFGSLAWFFLHLGLDAWTHISYILLFAQTYLQF
jgi:hypothetical protein